LAQDTIEQAIGFWLANDDAAAFPALSALAMGGDERAMLFLGAIELRSLDSAFLAGLDRETRNRMLRAPGGISGKSWLLQVTSDTARASALLAARDGDPAPLLALEERHAASVAILAAFNSAPWSLAELDRITPVPHTLRHLVWAGADMGLAPEVSGSDIAEDQKARLREALVEATDSAWENSLQLVLYRSMQQQNSSLPTPPPVEVLAGQILMYGVYDVQTRGDFAEATEAQRLAAGTRARAILAAAPEVAAVREICTKACPANPDACATTVWSLTGAGLNLGAFHTPLDSLVAQSAYLASPRYLADLRRAAKTPPPDADTCGRRVVIVD
jgi:hypothetical protein